MDNATWALARMNMILHGHPTADLWRGNTLAAPHFTTEHGLKTFDFAVANPPFSSKAWSNGLNPVNKAPVLVRNVMDWVVAVGVLEITMRRSH
jgi:type I restriction enzyme M protein